MFSQLRAAVLLTAAAENRRIFWYPPMNTQQNQKGDCCCQRKGGVGKSMVTSTMAVLTNRRGKKTAILDADITDSSIPKAFGVTEKAYGTQMGDSALRIQKGH